MKAKSRWVIVGSLLGALALGFGVGVPFAFHARVNASKLQTSFHSDRVVLFIGDGMGVNHVLNTELYYGENVSFHDEGRSYVSTSSLNLFGPTDSAAAATAVATGVKVDNGELSRHNKNDIPTLSEILHSRGYGVGVITTDKLSGATPAGFSSHADNRNDTEEIIANQIASSCDLLIGVSGGAYEPHAVEFVEAGFTYSPILLEQNAERLVVPYESSTRGESNGKTYNCKTITDFAISFMEKRFTKYFLMIEEAYTDKGSHNNNIDTMMKACRCLSDAYASAKNALENKDHFLMVTADHETGGLKKASSKEEIDNSLYSQTSHSSSDVLLYYETDKGMLPEHIDNTNIFDIVSSACF